MTYGIIFEAISDDRSVFVSAGTWGAVQFFEVIWTTPGASKTCHVTLYSEYHALKTAAGIAKGYGLNADEALAVIELMETEAVTELFEMAA